MRSSFLLLLRMSDVHVRSAVFVCMCLFDVCVCVYLSLFDVCVRVCLFGVCVCQCQMCGMWAAVKLCELL